MYTVKHYNVYGQPSFLSFEEAVKYCEKQAPLIGFKYVYFTITGENEQVDLTYKKEGVKWILVYKRGQVINQTKKKESKELPYVLIYNGSEQDIYIDKKELESEIKKVAPRMKSKTVIVSQGDNKFSVNAELEYTPVRYENGQYLTI